MKPIPPFLIALFTICCLGCSDCDPVSDPGNEAVVQFFLKTESGGYEAYQNIAFDSIQGQYWKLDKSFERKIDRIDTTVVDGEETYDTILIDVPIAGFVPLSNLFQPESDTSSVFLLPLSFERDSSIFSFTWTDSEGMAVAETLRLYHTSNIRINAPDCGFIDEFNLSFIADSPFDSFAIIDPIIKLDTSLVNIELYLNDTIPQRSNEGG